MSERMLKSERARFNSMVFSENYEDFTFEVWEEKYHKCCVVIVVRKGDIICREHRYPIDYLMGISNAWKRGIKWLQKELDEGIVSQPSIYEKKL